LKFLNLNNNALRQISTGSFENLVNLEELYMNENTLNILNSGKFKSLKKLQKLHFKKNQIKSLDEKIFEPLENLIDLDVSSNLLTILNEKTFYKKSKLEYLNVSFNKISKIHPNAFANISNIKFIDLTENKSVNKSFKIQNGNLDPIKKDLARSFANFFNSSTECNFTETNVSYVCLYENVNTKLNQKFYIYGVHKEGKLDSDVTRVKFISSELSVIPSTIFLSFKNLNDLNVGSTGLKEINQL
jgi:hypothetical protein